ncbi:hypothetical protein SNEBB_003192 [Seison nebaliae]|nr:hypothetical protein SNEBB_003192 [Seison nebaliae]
MSHIDKGIDEITSNDNLMSQSNNNMESQSNEIMEPVQTVTAEFIPEAPPIPELVQSLETKVSSLTDLGLGNVWLPTGWVQNALEFLHSSCDLSWPVAIGIGAICMRVIVFPIVISTQRNAAHLNNHMPQLQKLQGDFSDARISGNQMEAAKIGNEMAVFMKKKKIRPFRSALLPMAQLPFFMSMFLGIRGMANVPLPSLVDGGCLWFTDLTVADPYYIVPIVTAFTMYLTIEMGTEAGIKANSMNNTMKLVMRCMPIVTLPFTINFATAVTYYWLCANVLSLTQVSLLRIPKIRKKLKIPKRDIEAVTLEKRQKKSLIKGFSDSWKNSKLISEVEGRGRMEEAAFKKSGIQSPVQTFKHNPKFKK